MDGELRGRHESGSRAGSESQLPVSIAVWEGSQTAAVTPSPRQDRRSTAMMECFGISCFDAAQEAEEELVAEEAPRKKPSPPKRLKKKRKDRGEDAQAADDGRQSADAEKKRTRKRKHKDGRNLEKQQDASAAKPANTSGVSRARMAAYGFT